MSAEIDRLAALLAAATPGSWDMHGRPGRWLVAAAALPGFSADCPEREDAALIVAAVNALPRLLAVARAAENRDGCADLCVSMTPTRGCTCGHVELAAALAALGAGS